MTITLPPAIRVGSACRLIPAVWNRGRKFEVVSVAGEADRAADIDVVRERHPIGVDHALGPPGRARRVDQIPGRLRPASARASARPGAAASRRLIVAVEVDRRRRRGERGGGRGLAGAVEEQDRLGVGDQAVQLGRRHPPVQRHQDRAQFGAAEQELEKLDPVAGEDRDPVAARRRPRAASSAAARAGARVERGIGQRPPGRRVLERDPARRQLGALGDQIGEVGDHLLPSAPPRPGRWRGRRPRPGPCPRPRCA